MANNFIHFDMLAKHNPEVSKKYAVLLSIWYRNLRIGFKSSAKIISFWYICNSVSKQDKYIPYNFSNEDGVTLWHSTQRDFDQVTWLDFSKTYLPKHIPCFTPCQCTPSLFVTGPLWTSTFKYEAQEESN